ncbi:uncharacterized protein LOC118565344 isoform X3 [Fundulus heteroclitus]|uniref:uncharacterized protein LOC118565344 isoform X3 n=1 Tax=Fundulus heteroclitus TaxID=8078 RepID=UPI00165B0C31|nr:uncharacterized protein LOC118565344 isoform X3 [Fundulus heteroclitus]
MPILWVSLRIRCPQIKDNWGKFAEARQTTGPWTIKSFKHGKQMDSVSCGVFTIMFAECHLSVSPFRDCCLFTKRQQLTQELWAALDRTKRCGSCVKLLHGKGVKCGTCSGHCHTMCLQKKGLCFLCAYDSDVVQVDNTEEVVVVENATYTQMEAETTEKGVADGGLAQESAAAEGEQEECVTLSEDLNFLAAKFLPITKISQTCLEEGDGLHEAIAKTENCRKTLGHLLTTMEANWQNYGLATHGLGPQMLKGTFALIDTYLAKKI